jgi:hypothetical protein
LLQLVDKLAIACCEHILLTSCEIFTCVVNAVSGQNSHKTKQGSNINNRLCFQAKLKLEMEIEQSKKRVQKESDRKDEDMEEMKSNYTRKVRIFLRQYH